jgi:hypothetical protein
MIKDADIDLPHAAPAAGRMLADMRESSKEGMLLAGMGTIAQGAGREYKMGEELGRRRWFKFPL